MKASKLLLTCVLVAMAAASFGQFGGGGGFGRGGGRNAMNPGGLLSRDDVKKDLNLTNDQLDQITKIQEDAQQAMRDRMQGVDFQSMSDDDRQKMMAEGMKAAEATSDQIEAVLTKDQHARLLGIFIQLNGNNAIQSKEIQALLSITDAQKAKIKDLQAKQQDAMRSNFQKVQSGELQWSDMRPIMTKLRTVMGDELGKILTETQKSKMTSLEGAKFTPVDDQPGAPG
jgi:Spy/CpxP family protein refolding chaperone